MGWANRRTCSRAEIRKTEQWRTSAGSSWCEPRRTSELPHPSGRRISDRRQKGSGQRTESRTRADLPTKHNRAAKICVKPKHGAKTGELGAGTEILTGARAVDRNQTGGGKTADAKTTAARNSAPGAKTWPCAEEESRAKPKERDEVVSAGWDYEQGTEVDRSCSRGPTQPAQRRRQKTGAVHEDRPNLHNGDGKRTRSKHRTAKSGGSGNRWRQTVREGNSFCAPERESTQQKRIFVDRQRVFTREQTTPNTSDGNEKWKASGKTRTSVTGDERNRNGKISGEDLATIQILQNQSKKRGKRTAHTKYKNRFFIEYHTRFTVTVHKSSFSFSYLIIGYKI
jgi:hypothetical protein